MGVVTVLLLALLLSLSLGSVAVVSPGLPLTLALAWPLALEGEACCCCSVTELAGGVDEEGSFSAGLMTGASGTLSMKKRSILHPGSYMTHNKPKFNEHMK